MSSLMTIGEGKDAKHGTRASPRVSFVTLGCRVNQSETDAMRHRLDGTAFSGASPPDVVVINGCTVTALADRKTRQLLRRMRRRHPQAAIVLIGCVGDAVRQGHAEPVAADLIAGNAWKERIPEVVDHVLRGGRGRLPDPDAPSRAGRTVALPPPGRIRAFLKVQDGCDGVCTYCRTTQVRGRARSRPMQEILAEARTLVAQGIHEIVTVGVDLASFHAGNGGLPRLITELEEIPGLHRLRLGSLNPGGLTAELAQAIARSTIACPHLHVPLQSGDDAVLARMLRPYTRTEYLDAVARMRDAHRGMTFGTDLIVGFPGESEAAFRQTREALCEVGFVNTHIFRYSPRQGTRAASLVDDVPPSVKRRRAHQASRLARSIRERSFAAMVGTTRSVLLERQAGGWWRGYTAGYVRVRVHPTRGLHRGAIVQVRVTAADGDGLEGTSVDE
ncbi:MAG: MiaB/RimO family radical SAM methylthiotransferase [Candidatus Bipolaricaulota bacterium]|nr:MAG: MiaB/RimO family radical SAM methylthiotransferase [Candidatus Bipolaricaulota bacterium]